MRRTFSASNPRRRRRSRRLQIQSPARTRHNRRCGSAFASHSPGSCSVAADLDLRAIALALAMLSQRGRRAVAGFADVDDAIAARLLGTPSSCQHNPDFSDFSQSASESHARASSTTATPVVPASNVTSPWPRATTRASSSIDPDVDRPRSGSETSVTVVRNCRPGTPAVVDVALQYIVGRRQARWPDRASSRSPPNWRCTRRGLITNLEDDVRRWASAADRGEKDTSTVDETCRIREWIVARGSSDPSCRNRAHEVPFATPVCPVRRRASRFYWVRARARRARISVIIAACSEGSRQRGIAGRMIVSSIARCASNSRRVWSTRRVEEARAQRRSAMRSAPGRGRASAIAARRASRADAHLLERRIGLTRSLPRRSGAKVSSSSAT